jgi:hypothetical protein
MQSAPVTKYRPFPPVSPAATASGPTARSLTRPDLVQR